MKICVILLGGTEDCLPASSVNLGFFKKYNKPEITWIVHGEEEKKLLSFSNFVKKAYTANDITNSKVANEEFDLLVNFTLSLHPSDPFVNAKEIVGFNFEKDSSKYYEILYNNKPTKMNLFQVYYRLAGLKWRGEGYGIQYFPKTKAKKDRAAIAVDNLKLRYYIEDRLDLEGMRLSTIPYKKSIMKRMDELNKFSHIITDDLLTLHLSVYLRKFVHYLETVPLNTNMEFFGNGRLYQVPSKIVK